MNRGMDRLVGILIPVISVALFLVLWDRAIVWFDVPKYLIPRPFDVADALWTGYVGGRYWPHLFTTLREMWIGYAVGCSMALLVGALVAEFKTVERILFPFVIALQSMPKVALAPLLIVWFGFGIESKIVLVALICFFPVFVNSVTGFKSANADHIRLYRVFNASRLSIFLNVKVPSAAPLIFAGLQIAVVLALIGAVVGEFVSARSGLGFLIQSSTLNFDVATMFAAIISLSLVGVISATIIRALQRRFVFWIETNASTSTTAVEG